MPFEPNNKHGKGRPPAGHSLSEALRVALKREESNGRTHMMAIAQALVDKAKAGDVQAIRECFDRTEGRVPIRTEDANLKRPIVIQVTEADLKTM